MPKHRTLSRWLWVVVALASVCPAAFAQTTRPTMQWDRRTLRRVADGGYARIAGLKDGALLLTYEHRGRSMVKHSKDAGRTWGDGVLAAAFEHGGASNPQPLVLADGTVWLFYNERPRKDAGRPFTIRLTVSRDDGRTWTARPEPLYVAGDTFADGCWEPAAVRLASGEVRLYFANEGPYRASDEQEITMMRTADVGRTWSKPAAVSFRRGSRDGMPVPVELAGGRGVALAIEDNGLTPDRQMKPVVVRFDETHSPHLPVGGNDPRRRAAVDAPWPRGVYAGAPYLVRLPGGATLLSVQSDENRAKKPWMTVYVGDADAARFDDPSHPFPTDAGHEGLWNALFVKGDGTVIAISGTTVDGRGGVWLIDGVLK